MSINKKSLRELGIESEPIGERPKIPFEALVPGGIYFCTLRHCTTGGLNYSELTHVDEDDHSWRFTDESNSEVSYDWDVVDWVRIR